MIVPSNVRTTLHFQVADSVLREEITNGILPHLPKGQIGFHNEGAEWCPDTCLVAVCVSDLPSDRYLPAIRSAHARGIPCGIIVRMENRTKWHELSQLHGHVKFRFVVAVGGPRTELEAMFPGTCIASDITDLIVPGKQIAGFLWRAITRELQHDLEGS
jgi:hypothetical protein